MIIGDQVHYVDFDDPYKNQGWATERINDLKTTDGTELINLFKLTKLNIPDLRDYKEMMSTSIFGGQCVIIQEPRVPTYVLENQDDMAVEENKVQVLTQVNDICKSNANNLKLANDEVVLILFILPDDTLCYAPADKQPTVINRTTLMALRFMENKSWHVDDSMGHVIHNVWWGHYTYCLLDIDASRKILEAKHEPVAGLAAAFARGTTF